MPYTGRRFYEWEKLGKAKQPHYFQRKDGAPFFFAGIWDEWQLDGQSLTSCAIVTTRPNGLLTRIHDRMPAILPVEGQDAWLRGNAKPSELVELLAPFPSSAMTGYPVGQQVNSPKVDEPFLVEPAKPGEDLRSGMLF